MTPVHIRWMIRADMPHVLEIAKACGLGWDLETFLFQLRQRNVIGMVIEVNEIAWPYSKVVGYGLHVLHKKCIEIQTMAVHPKFQKQGIGRQYVDKIKSKLSPQRRSSVTAMLDERQLDAQCFMRQCGFKANQVLRGFFEDCEGEYDAYGFSFGETVDVLGEMEVAEDVDLRDL